MNLDNPIFRDDNAARAYMEAQRWADGVVCPHCGVMGSVASINLRSSFPFP